MPIPFEVTRNGEGKVVIHFFRRPDVQIKAGGDVVASALEDVFGRPTPSMFDKTKKQLVDCFYRDEEAIRVELGLKRPMLKADSWYVEFPVDTSAVLPESDYLRDRLAARIKEHWATKGATTID